MRPQVLQVAPLTAEEHLAVFSAWSKWWRLHRSSLDSVCELVLVFPGARLEMSDTHFNVSSALAVWSHEEQDEGLGQFWGNNTTKEMDSAIVEPAAGK